SIPLAREAIDTRASPETVAVLRAAIAASGVREVLDRDEGISMELVASSPDGKRAITGGSDGGAPIWQPRPRNLIASVKNPPADLLTVAFSRGGDQVLTFGRDGTLRARDAGTGKLLSTRTGPFVRRMGPNIGAGDEGPLIVGGSFSGDSGSVAVVS